MARFGKYTFVIYLLSALAALELIALAAVLAGPAVPAAAAAETAAAPEQMPAWLEPAPQREELPEEKDPPPVWCGGDSGGAAHHRPRHGRYCRPGHPQLPGGVPGAV